MTQRLAVLLPTLEGGGMERAMLALAGGFAARGYRVDVVAGHAAGALAGSVPPTTTLHNLGVPRPYTLARLPGLVRYLRRQRPAALLSAIDGTNLLALLARRLAGWRGRLVVSCHNHLSWEQHNWSTLHPRSQLQYRLLMPALVGRAYPHADAIVAVSHSIARDVAATAHLPRARITVLPHPIVTPDMPARAAAAPPHPWLHPTTGDTNVPVLLGVGRLHPRKDFATLLRAVALLRAERPVRLLLLGEGDERARLTALATELGIADAVALPGFVPDPLPAMARAAVLVLPSLTEGLGMVLVEAMAVGTPVVATRCEGAREVLADGRYGRLVPLAQPAALAAAIVATLDAPPPAALLQQRAADFTLEHSTAGYVRLLVTTEGVVHQ